MTVIVGANQYGKAEVRMVAVDRSAPEHTFADLNVGITLSGDLDDVHITGDNAHVVPTDTQKNTVFAFAKEAPVGEIEEFGLRLARHFVADFRADHARAGAHRIGAVGADRGRGRAAPALVSPGRDRAAHGDGRLRRRTANGSSPGSRT